MTTALRERSAEIAHSSGCSRGLTFHRTSTPAGGLGGAGLEPARAGSIPRIIARAGPIVDVRHQVIDDADPIVDD